MHKLLTYIFELHAGLQAEDSQGKGAEGRGLGTKSLYLNAQWPEGHDEKWWCSHHTSLWFWP